MTISRRRLLAGAGTGVLMGSVPARVAGAVVPTAAPAAPAAPTTRPPRLNLARVTADTFRPHVGTRFRLRRPGQPALRLKLVRVDPGAADAATRSFSLMFRSPERFRLGQGTYVVTHRRLGRFRVFLVPVAGWKVEAVINHVVT
jgi:hypothetical protein